MTEQKGSATLDDVVAELAKIRAELAKLQMAVHTLVQSNSRQSSYPR